MRLDFALFALAAPLAVLGDLRHSSRRTHSHHDIAKRADGHVQLFKRFSGTRWTFYDVGGAAGACGKFNSRDEHIVALNSAQYGGGYPGPHCWKKIVMKIGNKQTTAVITDECPGCPYGGLDLTRGLFEFFAPLGTGVLSGDWWFADEAPEEPKPTKKPDPPKPKPTTTHKPDPPKPTTHYQPTTSSTKKTTSTTSHSSTHSSTPSSSSSSSSSSSPSHATPSALVSVDQNETQNILACNQILANMGGVIVAGVEA